MDKEKESKNLKEKLLSIENAIRGELTKIETLKTRIAKGYRHRDKGKYDAERNEVQSNLEKLKTEQETAKKQLSELEAQNM